MSNKHIDPLFHVWCHKILPLVYDESLSYYENLCRFMAVLSKVIESQNNLQDELYQLKDWIDTQLESYSKEQLQEWLNDGTLENIINESLFNNLKTQIENLETNKTNLTEYNQNIIQSRGRTYGIYEKGVINATTSNAQELPPQISGIYPPSAENVNNGSRDSVSLYAYNVDIHPLIENSTTQFTTNSVTLENFDDTYTPNLMKQQLKDIDFSNTIIDVYTNGEHTFMGYVERYENKTFYLKDSGFYRVGKDTLTTGIPVNGSTIKIGEIKGIFGANIVAVNTGENGKKDLVGLEIDTINETDDPSRALMLITRGSCESVLDIISNDGKADNGIHLSKVGRIMLVDGFNPNGEIMRIVDTNNKTFLLTKNGTISPFGINAQGGITSENPTVNYGINVCICVSDSPFNIDLQTNFVYNELKFIMNFGTGAVTIPNIFGGRTLTLNTNESAIIYCLDKTSIYPIMKGVVGL